MSEKIKYPLPCGCWSPNYISMCAAHQSEAIEVHRRQLGISDLTFSTEDFDTDAGRDMILRTIRELRRRHPGRAFKIHILAPKE